MHNQCASLEGVGVVKDVLHDIKMNLNIACFFMAIFTRVDESNG